VGLLGAVLRRPSGRGGGWSGSGEMAAREPQAAASQHGSVGSDGVGVMWISVAAVWTWNVKRNWSCLYLSPTNIDGSYPSALPPYIHWRSYITDEYKPCIFINDVASPTNIRGWSKSTWDLSICVGAMI
jgi:hypothetical protein